MAGKIVYPKFQDNQKVYFKWGEDCYEGVVVGFTVLHNKITFYTVIIGTTRKDIAEKELFYSPEDLARALGETFITVQMFDGSVKGINVDNNTLRKFDIWSEGWCANEGVSPAHLVARGVEGTDFTDACKRHYKNDELFDIRGDRPCYWGCGLYDNEAEARRSFG